ncbi:MAG: glycogen debranching N-terminal domain-containing protein, partial [Microcella sp.]|nr:glycogen debranching N-terminal domain-containing protein [Microcella sp.]
MTHSMQPLIHDELVVMRAPTQVWSATDGSIGDAPVHGITHSDVRVVRGLRMRVGGAIAEHLVTAGTTADRVSIEALLRHLDDQTPDPGVRLRIERVVDIDGCADSITITTRHPEAITTTIELELDADATLIDLVKQGIAEVATIPVQVDAGSAHWSGEHVSVTLSTDGFRIVERTGGLLLAADVV